MKSPDGRQRTWSAMSWLAYLLAMMLGFGIGALMPLLDHIPGDNAFIYGLAGWLFLLVQYAIFTWVRGGLYRAVRREVDGEYPRFSDLVTGGRRYWWPIVRGECSWLLSFILLSLPVYALVGLIVQTGGDSEAAYIILIAVSVMAYLLYLPGILTIVVIHLVKRKRQRRLWSWLAKLWQVPLQDTTPPPVRHAWWRSGLRVVVSIVLMIAGVLIFTEAAARLGHFHPTGDEYFESAFLLPPPFTFAILYWMITPLMMAVIPWLPGWYRSRTAQCLDMAGMEMPSPVSSPNRERLAGRLLAGMSIGLIFLAGGWLCYGQWELLNRTTALHWAVEHDNVPVTRLLLVLHTPVNRVDGDGWTPLASAYEHPAIARLLLAHGANPDGAGKYGDVPLIVAGDNIPMLQLLLKAGAHTEIRNEYGKTPLTAAIFNGHGRAVGFLVTHGAQVNYSDGDGSAPLHIAIEEGYFSVLRFLLEHGADPNQRNGDGVTPLQLLQQTGDAHWVAPGETMVLSPYEDPDPEQVAQSKLLAREAGRLLRKYGAR